MAEISVYAEPFKPLKQLTSTRNPLLQTVHRAAAAGRPTEDGLIVIEGPHLLSEALRGEWRVELVLTTAPGLDRYAKILAGLDAEILEVSPRAFASLSATETGQEVLALVRPREWSWQQLVSCPSDFEAKPASVAMSRDTAGTSAHATVPDHLRERIHWDSAVVHPRALVVVLDGIQDPGNAGTIVRSAEAFGASGVAFLQGSARTANGKFLRATAGSIFRMPFLERVTTASLVEQIRSAELTLYALEAGGQTSVRNADFRRACALAVGSEGAGVSAELLSAGHAIFVPTVEVESLNAAVACSIALFSAQEQRGRG